MSDQHALRPAQPQDFAFCERLYFEGMAEIIATLEMDMAQQRESFTRQWQAAQVRIIMIAGDDAGWLQTAAADGAVFLGQLYLDTPFQQKGIGSQVVRALIDEAAHEQKAVTLAVVKINRARWLYERLGFRTTHEDEHKVYMRREPGPTPT